uniref:Uncharacterized protein n=1 Tax=Aegilops tauschii TaxID=37682 RepID=M8CWH8_AEGTA
MRVQCTTAALQPPSRCLGLPSRASIGSGRSSYGSTAVGGAVASLLLLLTADHFVAACSPHQGGEQLPWEEFGGGSALRWEQWCTLVMVQCTPFQYAISTHLWRWAFYQLVKIACLWQAVQSGDVCRLGGSLLQFGNQPYHDAV